MHSIEHMISRYAQRGARPRLITQRDPPRTARRGVCVKETITLLRQWVRAGIGKPICGRSSSALHATVRPFGLHRGIQPFFPRTLSGMTLARLPASPPGTVMGRGCVD
jgi:hypothetical protein